VFDAVLVWSAAVFDTPEDGVGSAAGIDFAVGPAPFPAAHHTEAQIAQTRQAQTRDEAVCEEPATNAQERAQLIGFVPPTADFELMGKLDAQRSKGQALVLRATSHQTGPARRHRVRGEAVLQPAHLFRKKFAAPRVRPFVGVWMQPAATPLAFGRRPGSKTLGGLAMRGFRTGLG
jgi:hypothetical protein